VGPGDIRRTGKGFLVAGHDDCADGLVVVKGTESIVDLDKEGRREGVE